MKRQAPFEIMAARMSEIFKKNRISPDVKLLAALLYHLGLSYRRTSLAMGLFCIFSHESVRLWYRKIGTIFPQPDKIHRSIIVPLQWTHRIQRWIRVHQWINCMSSIT